MTLTQAALATKRAIIIFIISLVLVISGWVGFQYWYTNYYLPGLPPEIIKPEVKFGPLPLPVLPKSIAPSDAFTYVLNTEDGNLPKGIPQLMNIYFIPQLGATLLAPDRVRELAENFDFTQGPEKISPNLHKFRDSIGGEMTIDLNTDNFQIIRQEATESATLEDAQLPEQGKIIADFKNYLSGKRLLKDSLKTGRAKVIYEKPSQQDSTRATVTLWPEDIKNGNKDYPIVTDKPDNGLVSAEVLASNNSEKYSKISFHYWEPDKENSSTYPIKNPGEAFEELKTGKGYLIKAPSNYKASITKIYLAYYMGEEYSEYTQPVYVFEGESFLSYVLAVTSEYLSSESSEKPSP